MEDEKTTALYKCTAKTTVSLLIQPRGCLVLTSFWEKGGFTRRGFPVPYSIIHNAECFSYNQLITIGLALFQTDELGLSRFLGGASIITGGVCCVAKARNASANRCGCDLTSDFHPWDSITSLACRLIKSTAWAFNCSAVCKSARIRVSQAFSVVRLWQSACSQVAWNYSGL